MICQTISRCRILEHSAGGGMGVISKAHDKKLDRDVVLKFLPAYLTCDCEAKECFIHGAQAASALDHPGIYMVIDIRERAEG